jgi:hypothetical protein
LPEHADGDGLAAATALERFVDALPKVELHVHLEGSVRPESLLTLAAKHGLTRVPDTLEGLREFYRFQDFAHFIEVYYAVCDHLTDEQDFALVARELGEHLAGQGVRYAEVTITPFNHTRRGVPAGAVFEGIERGRLEAEAATGIRLRWCVDIPGEFGPRRAWRRRTWSASTDRRASSASDWAARRLACRGPSSRGRSRSPGTPACTACPTPARRWAPRRSGTR